jgi:hypothetical protein
MVTAGHGAIIVTVKVDWVQSLAVIAPVYRHTVIKRRKGERTIAVDWHIAARRIVSA